MAYTTIFTKESVRLINKDNYTLSIKVVVNDGVDDIVEKVVSVRYNTGWNVSDVKAKFVTKFKLFWDNYIDENNIYESVAFDTLTADIKSLFDTYINL